jgi:hypothetical protein
MMVIRIHYSCWVVWNFRRDDFGSASVIVEVLIAKVGVLVGDTRYVDSDGRIASSWSAWLDMSTSVGADDQAVGAVDIETVLCADAGVISVENELGSIHRKLIVSCCRC